VDICKIFLGSKYRIDLVQKKSKLRKSDRNLDHQVFNRTS